MANITNITNERTINNSQDGLQENEVAKVQTIEVVEGGEVLETNVIDTPNGAIIETVLSDSVYTRKVNGEVRSIITRA